MYKMQPNKYEENISVVIRVLDNAFIPLEPDNTDYQAYLKWVAEGNTPESADE